MPFYPAHTLNNLKLLFAQRYVNRCWGHFGWGPSTYSNVKPLPSFWSLPADSYAIGLLLALCLCSPQPTLAVHNVLNPPHLQQTLLTCDRPVRVVGFSAGSLTGMFVYRLLIERGHLVGLKFAEGILGSIAMHPILFYDFLVHGNQSPLETTEDYRASIAVELPRPVLVHCFNDWRSKWKPSAEALGGVKAFRNQVILIKLSGYLVKRSTFWYFHNHYRYSL